MSRYLVVLGALVLLATSCGGRHAPAETAPARAAARDASDTGPEPEDVARPQPPSLTAELERCELVPGELSLDIPRPEGFLFQCDPAQNALRAFAGALNPMEAELLVQAFAIATDDAGPEQLLNDPVDGARQWVLSTGVLGPSAHPTSEGAVEVDGRQVSYFCIVGRPQGMSARREALLFRLDAGEHNLVLIALYAPDDPAMRDRALSILRGARFELLD